MAQRDGTILTGWTNVEDDLDAGVLRIPEDITGIGVGAFETNNSITGVDFSACTALATIGAHAFKRCSFLSSITWPTDVSTLTSIGTEAFRHCAFTGIALPQNANIVYGDFVFADCPNLVDVVIPSNFNFTDGNGIQNGQSMFANSPITPYPLMDDSITRLPLLCFSGSQLVYVNLPPSFEILNNAFSGIQTLQELYIPASVTEITADALDGCSALISILYDGLTDPAVETTIISEPNAALVVNVLQSYDGTTFGNLTVTKATPEDKEGVPCFVSGTCILSQNGYKPIEKFTREDFLVTSDNRTIDFKLHKTTIKKSDESTAPYVIQPHAFGRNKPLAPLYLSPTHKIQIRKGLWTSPQTAAKTNALITRMPFGQSVTYYHVECENYLRDNVIAEGVVAESYGIAAAKKAVGKFYTWNQKLGGYTRQGYATLTNTISH